MPGFFNRDRQTTITQGTRIASALTMAYTLYQRRLMLPESPENELLNRELEWAAAVQLMTAYSLRDAGSVPERLLAVGANLYRTYTVLTGLTAPDLIVPWYYEALNHITTAVISVGEMLRPYMPENPENVPAENNPEAGPAR